MTRPGGNQQAHSGKSLDPLKGWGDVLAKQGNAKQALAKYEEALKYAPNWKELKDLRGGLAKHARQFGLPITAGGDWQKGSMMPIRDQSPN